MVHLAPGTGTYAKQAYYTMLILPDMKCGFQAQQATQFSLIELVMQNQLMVYPGSCILFPVLTPTSGTWDQFSIQFPFVIRENGQYKMWYSSSPQADYNQCKIGYATSPDGINWTKLAEPVLEAGTEPWEAGGVMACYVMPVTGGYKIWYTGFTTALANGNLYIGYAISEDGISWQRDTINNPVLEPGVTGGWEGKWVWYPEVLFIDEMYYMWYAGSNIGFWDRIDVGLATSSDGIEWTKHQQNPVLSPSQGMWDWPKVECSSKN